MGLEQAPMHAASHTPQGLAVQGDTPWQSCMTTMGDPNPCTAFGKDSMSPKGQAAEMRQ